MGRYPKSHTFSILSRVHSACATDMVKSDTYHYQSSPNYTQLLTLTLCPFKQLPFKMMSWSALVLVVIHRMSCITLVMCFHHGPRTPNPTAHLHRCWAWQAHLVPLKNMSHVQMARAPCHGPWLSEQSLGWISGCTCSLSWASSCNEQLAEMWGFWGRIWLGITPRFFLLVSYIWIWSDSGENTLLPLTLVTLVSSFLYQWMKSRSA